ncbi:MAG: general stress protein [Thermincola sp.]|nr:general stress protein [Thermincola sp.]MDT3702745.1 general stress protein [Thermincola sp.]
MSKTVIGVFASRDQAEKAVSELRNKGFEKEISILAKDDQSYEGTDQNTKMFGGDSLADGATTGGVIGGIAGLAIGAGALAIPGLGPIIAAGPIAGMLSGAATGGIAGGLADWGIPEDRGRYYEGKVKEGRIVATVKTDDNKINSAADILRKNGAQDVETH